MRQAVIYQDESGGWVAEVPSLPGCNSQGDTFEEAVENIRAAIRLYIASLKDDGQPIPAETYRTHVVAV